MIVVIVDECVFFVEWEALGNGEGQFGGFACHFVTCVVQLVYKCSVVGVPSDPDGLKWVCRVAFFDCCKEPIP